MKATARRLANREETQITYIEIIVRDGFEIKEDLKKMGFRFDSNAIGTEYGMIAGWWIRYRWGHSEQMIEDVKTLRALGCDVITDPIIGIEYPR